ncbi:hypothetical protein [Hymenobacter cheonanensis]|uniref:hypothetical protein n=1 Tax=Hymenobacter sp. CA2-7 TaxID=3063993 RepID=UPI00271387FD|nr:hypothetical protein [Hymenobacter sp. CA2-7]MDO7883999.1 hypothetical protein [Hymenobacter sp. CA2-7]
MKASIYSNQTLIGHTDLRPGDAAMGGVYGEFIPTVDYYRSVQKTVWEFNANTSPDYTAWQALALNVQLENGYFLFPMGGYSFDDNVKFPNEPIQVYLAGIAAEILEDFISFDPPRTFVEEPWEALTIAQKLALEAEFGREWGNIFKSPLASAGSSSVVVGAQFSALCRLGTTDDVLFSVRESAAFTSPFALVHLTWSGRQEQNLSFPKMIFFNSFAEFKLERMYPDRSDWEY